MIFTEIIRDALGLAVACAGSYGAVVYAMKGITKKSTAECKSVIKSEIRQFLRSSASDIPLSEAEINAVLKAVARFSQLKLENTYWQTDYTQGAPFLKVEIYDMDFEEHFPVIQKSIGNILGRKFFFENVDWAAHVTFEETFRENLYNVVVHWATTRKSKRHLQKLMESTAKYNRREDLAKQKPPADEELEQEMEQADRD